MNRPTIVYVYQHTNGDIRVMPHEEAFPFDRSPEWNHLATLKADTYIQDMLKNNPSLVANLRSVTE